MADTVTNDQQTQTQAPDDQQPDIEALRAENERLKAEREQLMSRLDRLETVLIEQGMRGRQVAGNDHEPGPEPPARHKAPEQEPDFDTMTARDMVQYVLGKFEERLSEAEKRVNQQIQKVVTETQAARLVDEVSDVIADYGEEAVSKHQKSIIQLMARNPELTVEEALLLAARRAGEELVPKSKKAGAESTAEGLPPRGPARPAARKEAPPTNFAEAGQRAWRQLGLKL